MIAPLVLAALTAPPQEAVDTMFGVESPTYVAIRAVLSTALVGLLGILSMHLVVLPRARRGALRGTPEPVDAVERAMLPYPRALLWIMLTATVARLAAQHAAFFGADESWSRSTLRALLVDSPWGRGWWLALAAIALGFLGASRIRRVRSLGWTALTMAAVVMAASMAMSGHAAVSTMATINHALHVIGAGGWIGTLAALMLIAVPAVRRSAGGHRDEQIAAMIRAFSASALGFGGILAVSGTIGAWRNVETGAGLFNSPYGRVLLVKLALLSVAAGTGAYNWRRVLPSLGRNPSSTARVRRSAAVELVAALAILLVTAVLVATPVPGDG